MDVDVGVGVAGVPALLLHRAASLMAHHELPKRQQNLQARTRLTDRPLLNGLLREHRILSLAGPFDRNHALLSSLREVKMHKLAVRSVFRKAQRRALHRGRAGRHVRERPSAPVRQPPRDPHLAVTVNALATPLKRKVRYEPVLVIVCILTA